jgi:hypothetical protein
MLTMEAGQQDRYGDALDAVAVQVIAELGRRGVTEDWEDAAVAEVARLAAAGSSEHAWIFRDPAVLRISESVFEALDARPDGRRAWLHADLASAIAAVARFDVMVRISELFATLASDEENEAEPAGQGEA